MPNNAFNTVTKMADKLNRESQGDQAAIYMVKN